MCNEGISSLNAGIADALADESDCMNRGTKQQLSRHVRQLPCLTCLDSCYLMPLFMQSLSSARAKETIRDKGLNSHITHGLVDLRSNDPVCASPVNTSSSASDFRQQPCQVNIRVTTVRDAYVCTHVALFAETFSHHKVTVLLKLKVSDGI